MGATSEILFEGTIGNFTLDEIFEVVGLSRQVVRVTFSDDDGGPIGEVVIKAGRVLDATAPPSEGREAFHRLYRQAEGGFRVLRTSHEIVSPIGSISELVEECVRDAEAPRDVVLAGRFKDFQFEEVLDVLSMTRQLVELTTDRADGSTTRLVIKAGQVLVCSDTRDNREGLSAFESIFKDPGESFEVTRNSTFVTTAAPLSSLADAVQSARPQPRPAGLPTILDGGFEGVALADVLASLSLSRLSLEIILRAEGKIRGTIVLKSGFVELARSIDSGAVGKDAFFEMLADPGEPFAAVRRELPANNKPGTSCGPLRELLLEANNRRASTPSPRAPRPPQLSQRPKPPTLSPRKPNAPAPPPVPRPKPKSKTPAKPRSSSPAAEVLLRGSFEQFSVEEVLSVLSLSRQYVSLVTLRERKPLGRLAVKSGRLLLTAYGTERRPVAVLRGLLDDPGTHFQVRQLRSYPGEEIGSLEAVLNEARGLGDGDRDAKPIVEQDPGPAAPQAAPKVPVQRPESKPEPKPEPKPEQLAKPEPSTPSKQPAAVLSEPAVATAPAATDLGPVLAAIENLRDETRARFDQLASEPTPAQGGGMRWTLLFVALVQLALLGYLVLG